MDGFDSHKRHRWTATKYEFNNSRRHTMVATATKTKKTTTTVKSKVKTPVKLDTSLKCPHCGGIGLSKGQGRPAKGFEGQTKYKCPVCETVTYSPLPVEVHQGIIDVEAIAVAEERMVVSPEETTPGGTMLLLPYKEALPVLCGGPSTEELEVPSLLKEEEGFYAIETPEEEEGDETDEYLESPMEEARSYLVETGVESVVLRKEGRAEFKPLEFLRVVVYGGDLQSQLSTLQGAIESLKDSLLAEAKGWRFKSQTLTGSPDATYGSRLTFTTFMGRFDTHPIAERVAAYLNGIYHPNLEQPDQEVELTGKEVIVRRRGKEARAPWKGSYAGLLFSWGREVFAFLKGKTDTLW
jgi:predicted RNA-binding Zn-ribbon protein involved in translation (DUF1610 family)